MLKRWLRRLCLVVLVWGIARSGRVVLVNWHVLERLRRNKEGFLVGLWHNNIFCLIDLMGSEDYPTMISRSRDGEDIGWISSRFGIVPVWGSPAMGGSGALRQALRLLHAGQPVIVTPDGPRGPRYVVKPGIVALARRTRMPIVPLACSALRRWELRSWDRMKLPKPFATLAVLVGDPIRLDPAEADEETQRRRVEAILREHMRRAEAFTGADAIFPDPELEQPLGAPQPAEPAADESEQDAATA